MRRRQSLAGSGRTRSDGDAVAMILAAMAMLTLGGLGIVPPPLPTQTAPPLKEISHVVASPLCSMLSEKGRPAIAGLMLNDGLTDYVGPVIARYYRDMYADHSVAADFDIVRMREVAVRMAHNLEVVDAILASVPKPDAKTAPSNAQRQIEDLRDKLNAVQNAQRATINVVSGLAETEALGEFESRKDPLGNAVEGDVPKGGGKPASASGNAKVPEGWGGLAPTAVDAGDPRQLATGMMLGANAITPYLDSLSDERTGVRRAEGVAADAILQMAKACNAQPSPAPSAKP